MKLFGLQMIDLMESFSDSAHDHLLEHPLPVSCYAQLIVLPSPALSAHDSVVIFIALPTAAPMSSSLTASLASLRHFDTAAPSSPSPLSSMSSSATSRYSSATLRCSSSSAISSSDSSRYALGPSSGASSASSASPLLSWRRENFFLRSFSWASYILNCAWSSFLAASSRACLFASSAWIPVLEALSSFSSRAIFSVGDSVGVVWGGVVWCDLV